MSGINEVKYILDESVRMLNYRKISNLISVIIMGFSLLVLITFIFVALNVSMVFEKGMEEMCVYVYLQDGTSDKTTEEIRTKLSGLDNVRSVIFIPKKEALEKFRERLGESSEILEELGANPLPDAFRVKMKPEHTSSAFMEEIASAAMGWKGVDDVRYGRKWVERGEKLIKGFYMIGMVLGLIVFISVIFVISNTVRLSILSRRESVEIMKLVGAANRYIEVPFVIEGAVQGIVSSIIAMALLWALCTFAGRYMPGLGFFRLDGVVGFVVLCAFLGSIGSSIAIRKFLKR